MLLLLFKGGAPELFATIVGTWHNVIDCRSLNERIECYSANYRIECKSSNQRIDL